MAAAADSLYTRIGGEAALTAAVDVFYEKVVADDRVKNFFAGRDMGLMRRRLALFLTHALGGPHQWTGRDMRTAHMHLIKNHGLNTSHFDAVAELLVATLQQLGVSQALIDEVVAVVATLRPQFLGLEEGA